MNTPGALVTALLFTMGKIILEIYIGTSHIDSTYGAAGSLIVVLVWVYYSAQILFIGAEFTKVNTLLHGMKIKPSENFTLIEKSKSKKPK